MTPARLMRAVLPTLRRSGSSSNQDFRVAASGTCHGTASCLSNCRCFAQVNDTHNRNHTFWFSRPPARGWPSDTPPGHAPPDERTIQLGKTVRSLHDRLPTLLKEPLPSHILSQSITLHLFPSTHPHLPTVSGRIAYVAALWTAPVAWGRMPLIGNVQLHILSERMVREAACPSPSEKRAEKLIVKWKTCGKTTHRDGTGGIYRGMGLSAAKDPMDKIKDFIAGTSANKQQADAEEFCGIFIFEFDDDGRIKKHTIEHTEEGGHWEKTTRVVSVTDWLLGQFNGRKKEETPGLAWCEERPNCGPIRLVDRRQRV